MLRRLIFLPGPADLPGRSDRTRFIRVGTQCFLMRTGVSNMIFWQSRLPERFMRGMRKRVVERMVPGILKMTVPVHTRPFSFGSLLRGLLAGRSVSG